MHWTVAKQTQTMQNNVPSIEELKDALQNNLGFGNTSAVPQTDRLHAPLPSFMQKKISLATGHNHSNLPD